MRRLEHCNIVKLKYFFYSSGEKVRTNLPVSWNFLFKFLNFVKLRWLVHCKLYHFLSLFHIVFFFHFVFFLKSTFLYRQTSNFVFSSIFCFFFLSSNWLVFLCFRLLKFESNKIFRNQNCQLTWPLEFLLVCYSHRSDKSVSKQKLKIWLEFSFFLFLSTLVVCSNLKLQ